MSNLDTPCSQFTIEQFFKICLGLVSSEEWIPVEFSEVAIIKNARCVFSGKLWTQGEKCDRLKLPKCT